ncbi:hypothetical protein LAY57_33815 [Argonema antarcticum A004/B2]|nr:hypothetical protein [Argonema antarcticum A004/B2]
MYLSSRSALVRNMAVSVVNGSITLIILLIAPLGLVAVIINTLLVTLFSFVTATAADRIVGYLTPQTQEAELLNRANKAEIRQRDADSLDRK